MASGYCVKCQNYAQNPISYDGKLYCQRCIGKVVPDEGGESPVSITVEEPKYIYPDSPSGPANIPLRLQKQLLHSSFYDTAEWMREMLDDDDFMADLEKMAEMRLEENYPRYGSSMYGWSEDELFRNEMEEMADVFVYKSAEGR